MNDYIWASYKISNLWLVSITWCSIQNNLDHFIPICLTPYGVDEAQWVSHVQHYIELQVYEIHPGMDMRRGNIQPHRVYTLHGRYLTVSVKFSLRYYLVNLYQFIKGCVDGSIFVVASCNLIVTYYLNFVRFHETISHCRSLCYQSKASRILKSREITSANNWYISKSPFVSEFWTEHDDDYEMMVCAIRNLRKWLGHEK